MSKIKLAPVALAPPTFAVAKAKAVGTLTAVLTASDVDIIITSADGVALAEIVKELTALTGAAPTLVPDTSKVIGELLNADVASMVITKLAVLPAGMSTAVLAEPVNAVPSHC